MFIRIDMITGFPAKICLLDDKDRQDHSCFPPKIFTLLTYKCFVSNTAVS